MYANNSPLEIRRTDDGERWNLVASFLIEAPPALAILRCSTPELLSLIARLLRFPLGMVRVSSTDHPFANLPEITVD